MNKPDSKLLNEIANTIRGLSIDAIEAAKCGHPGLPLGCAEIGAYLYAEGLRYAPDNAKWANRDRFILSAGHGSMLLYACLHLAGISLSLEDLKNFRQLGSPTAGHPEFGEADGIETTTGPLGQGLVTATGMALAQKMTQSQLGVQDTQLLDGQIVVLASDGCIMEGVTSESSSLAGHLGLDNLIVFYDSNDICLDGPTSECLSEDTAKRYEAYGWHVDTINGHSTDEIRAAFTSARSRTDKPTLIIAKTEIGFGSPNFAGTSDVHGKALGEQEARLTKEKLGIPTEPFHVPASVSQFFEGRRAELNTQYQAWQSAFESWAKANPDAAAKWQQFEGKQLPSNLNEAIKAAEHKPNSATRESSNAVLAALAKQVPHLVGGSADLSCSDKAALKGESIVTSQDFSGRNIKYGVREFAMAAMSTGISLHGMLTPFCGTFLTFSDYMRNGIRLAALMKQQVIYQFTHDSIFLGEDGPTHQPIEHLASLRAMPNLTVIRPADANEVKGAWMSALRQNGPTAIILSRLGVPDLEATNPDNVAKGAYVLKKERNSHVNYLLMATGSEVQLALDVAGALEDKGFSVRVVSVPSFELFNAQSDAYKAEVLGGQIDQKWAIEAQSAFGWHQYVGSDGHIVSVDQFGYSAPSDQLAEKFGFTTPQILERMATVGLPKESIVAS